MHDGVEQPFAAEQLVLDARHADDFHRAGVVHRGEVARVHDHRLAALQIVFHRRAVDLQKRRAAAGELLHDEAFAAEQTRAELLLEEYGQIAAFLENLSFGNLSAIRNFTGDEAKKERIQKERKAIKASIDEIKKKYFMIPLDGMVDQLKRMRPVVEELIRVAAQYMDTLAKTKREKRIADFNDIEHFALNILVDETTREQRPTAQEFQELFEVLERFFLPFLFFH